MTGKAGKPAAPRPNNIAAIREARQLTQEVLAERIGFSVSYLSRMERGGRNISVKTLRKIADALSVEISELLDNRSNANIPIVTWVSAGQLARDDGQQEIIGEIQMPGLDAKGQWIALQVEGDSMDRISPPGSIIFVNLLDTALVPNACYVVADDDNNTTYKRFRPNPPRFEAVSNNDAHNPIYPDGDPIVIGRVRRSMIDM